MKISVVWCHIMRRASLLSVLRDELSGLQGRNTDELAV